MVCWPVIVDPEPTDRDPDPNFKTQTVFKEIVSHANVHAGEVRFDHSNGRRRIECRQGEVRFYHSNGRRQGVNTQLAVMFECSVIECRQGEVRLKWLQVEDSSFTVPPET
jgi:hypothetical protein